MTTIALCMIVKNEAHVIERCLKSALPWVTHAFISDTGSEDDTLAQIDKAHREYGANVGLTVFVEPWVDFSTNRNSVIDHARAHGVDYMLFLDADEELRMNFAAWPLDTYFPLEAYWLPIDYDGLHYRRMALVSTKIPAQYKGVVHEYLEIPPDIQVGALSNPTIVVHHEGARSRDPDTYKKDAELLRRAFQQDRSDLRSLYYLAQSLRDAGRPHLARDRYLQRAAAGGWQEEAWSAMYEAAKLTERDDPEQAVHYYLAAYQMHPKRAEPLYQLARYYRERQQWACAYLFAMSAAQIGYPATDRLFVDASIYRWRIPDEVGMAAYYMGEIELGRAACENALNCCPTDQYVRIAANKAWYDQSPHH